MRGQRLIVILLSRPGIRIENGKTGDGPGPVPGTGPGTAMTMGTNYFTSAGSGTFAFRNAGITSSAKRSNCSSATDFGTPTDRLIEIRSSPG